MSLYILDTDHITSFQQNHPLVKQRVEAISAQEIAVTAISLNEQMRGWLNAINQSGKSDRILWAYTGLLGAVQFFNTVRVLQFDRPAYNIFLALQSQKIRIGTQDLRIAAIALSVKGIVVTRNRRDFEKITDLILEDWRVSIN
ncbi:MULTISPECIES: type II toxin-antitoxin system VapC family toxin [Spirulina sp. CCY15215]|uniref:type II toxin-antitoxin system VapC family toxin n=1 Tax=Spirulina sp. CCY15215 TaxID=2767591 RepID=UPI001951E32A|nr:type II toxin-antitoxin system VapC family toxin [Spirulina major]